MDVRPGSARTLATVLGSLAVTALGGALIAAVPWFIGVSWTAIGGVLAHVPVVVLAGMVVLWFAGLVVHARVLMAAMPGLTMGQALRLNLSGSAVSNVLPLGGPAGMGLGYAMARSWGFGPDRFASYTVSTNLWNAVGKLVMGMLVLAGAALFDVGLPSGLGRVVLSAVAFVAVSGTAAAVALRNEQATVAIGRRLDRWIASVRPGAGRTCGCSAWLLSSRRELQVAVRAGWRRMSVGVLCYLALQAALLYGCLTAAGAGVSLEVVAITFAIERLISLAPITPGAAGVAELGTVAALHSFGVDPVSATAGVLLYRTLMFAVEIPVGGVIALTWLSRVRRQGSGRLPADELDDREDLPFAAEQPVLSPVGGG